MTIPFLTFFERLRKATDIDTQMALAEALGVNRSAITQAKLRNAVPQKWILTLARRYSLSPDWLEFGTGTPEEAGRLKKGASVSKIGLWNAGGRFGNLQAGGELQLVPKAAARLCAGGGSFEVDAVPVAEYPLPRAWLAGLGNPSSMVFMDVVGDSMEPGIYDGDMVLVDTSNHFVSPDKIFAVGFDDAIYLKRVERVGDTLRLLSDNAAYAAIELRGDELGSFRVIGKMVWLCRDYA